MPGSRKKATTPSSVAEAAALAWSGRHEDAIALATTALAGAHVALADRLDLLDLRAESFIALGDLAAARADADAMLDIARRAKKPRAACAGAQPPRVRGDPCRELARRGQDRGRRARSGAPQRAAGPRGHEPAPPRRGAVPRARQRARREDLPRRRHACSKRSADRSTRDVPCGRSPRLAAVRARSPRRDRAAHEALARARATGDLYGVGNAHQHAHVPRGRHRSEVAAAYAVACGVRGSGPRRAAGGHHPQPRQSVQ